MMCIPFCLSVKFVNEKPSSKTGLKSIKDKAFNTMNQFLLLKHNFCETWLNVHQFCWLTMWRLSHKAKFCIIKPKKNMIPVPHGNMSRILSFKGYNAWFTFDSGISIPFPWLMWMMIPKMMGISARFPSLDGNRCTIPFTEWEQFKLLEKVSDSRPWTGIDNRFPPLTGI